MKKYNIAIVGASGLVGRKILEILDEFDIPINELYLYSSSRSAGKIIEFKGVEYKIIELQPENITDKNIDYAFFSAGGGVSKVYAPIFAKQCVVIDNSSVFRMDENVPLVVPEVNPSHAYNASLISNPNCSTIQAVVALKPLHDKYKIKRVIFSTYQAVSGAGKQGLDDFESGITGGPNTFFPYPIFNNVIPHIDSFLDNGYTKEEYKMINETKKILEAPDLQVTATTTRIPVRYGHSISANIEMENDFETIDEIKQLFRCSKGIVLYDDVSHNIYPMPIIAENQNEVFVGRIRRDNSIKSGLNIWIVADNIRKGAATNAVQILQLLIQSKEV